MNSWLYVSLNNEKIDEIDFSNENINIEDESNEIIEDESNEIIKDELNEIIEDEPKEIIEDESNEIIKDKPKKVFNHSKLFSMYLSNVENMVYEQIINVGICYDYLSFENKICMIGIFAVFCTSLM
jgi:hypothetical protein